MTISKYLVDTPANFATTFGNSKESVSIAAWSNSGEVLFFFLFFFFSKDHNINGQAGPSSPLEPKTLKSIEDLPKSERDPTKSPTIKTNNGLMTQGNRSADEKTRPNPNPDNHKRSTTNPAT